MKKIGVLLAVLAVASTGAFAQAPATEVLDSPVHYAFDPEAVGNVLNSAPHAGSSPLACGQDSTNGNFYVADLFTGFAHRYTETLGFLATFAHPFGAATTTGITFNETSGNSLIMCVNAGGGTCLETDLNGSPIGAPFIPANPSAGLLAGHSYDLFGTDGNPSLWYVDIVNDDVIECDPGTGAFKSTHAQPNGGGGFGNGTDATNCCTDGPNAGDGLDTLAGLGSAGQVTEAAHTDQAGGVLGVTSVLATGDTFVNDVARTLDYDNTAVQAVYLVGNASNTLFVVEAHPYTCGPCNGDGGGGGDDGGGGDGGGVPATGGIGVAMTVLALLGSSAYFLRRKN
jgi:hypothetical protein